MLIYYDADTQSANLRGNTHCQATIKLLRTLAVILASDFFLRNPPEQKQEQKEKGGMGEVGRGVGGGWGGVRQKVHNQSAQQLLHPTVDTAHPYLHWDAGHGGGG